MGKKDGGYHPVINLKMLNQFIPFLHFKIEGLSQLKHITGEQLDVQTGPEGCILHQCPFESTREEVHKISANKLKFI